MAVIAEDEVCPAAEARACRQLWCDVFLACLRDAARDLRDPWLGSRDYFMVAALAGIEHEVARDLVARIRTRCALLAL